MELVNAMVAVVCCCWGGRRTFVAACLVSWAKIDFASTAAVWVRLQDHDLIYVSECLEDILVGGSLIDFEKTLGLGSARSENRDI